MLGLASAVLGLGPTQITSTNCPEVAAEMRSGARRPGSLRWLACSREGAESTRRGLGRGSSCDFDEKLDERCIGDGTSGVPAVGQLPAGGDAAGGFVASELPVRRARRGVVGGATQRREMHDEPYRI